MASGYSQPRQHHGLQGAEHVEGYESVSVDPEEFKGQRVLVVGSGNAALEIANAISTRTAATHLVQLHSLHSSSPVTPVFTTLGHHMRVLDHALHHIVSHLIFIVLCALPLFFRLYVSTSCRFTVAVFGSPTKPITSVRSRPCLPPDKIILCSFLHQEFLMTRRHPSGERQVPGPVSAEESRRHLQRRPRLHRGSPFQQSQHLHQPHAAHR